MDNKFENIDELIKDIDFKLEKVNEQELVEKSEKEQELLKKQWEDQRNNFSNKLEKEQKVFDKKIKKLNDDFNKLIPIDEMNKMIKQYIEEMDLKWEEALKATINDIFKDKTDEEKLELFNLLNNNEEK